MKLKNKESEEELRLLFLDIIHESIAEYYCISKPCVFDKSRKKEVIPRRQWFQYFAYKLKPKISYAYIGKYYSNKSWKIYDHATVRHNVMYIKDSIKLYSTFRKTKLEISNIIDFRIKQQKKKEQSVLFCSETTFPLSIREYA